MSTMTLTDDLIDSTFLSTEDSLLSGLLAGEEAAFEELVRTYGPRMLSVARRYLKSADDAEDAVQQAFLAAFTSLKSFESRSCIATWLHRILINVCLMQIRHRQRHPSDLMDDLLTQSDFDDCPVQPVCDWSQFALASLTQEETRAQVRTCLEMLPESYRLVVQLRDIEEFDTATVAGLLGISRALVKTRLHRARLALRNLLNGLFEQETLASV